MKSFANKVVEISSVPKVASFILYENLVDFAEESIDVILKVDIIVQSFFLGNFVINQYHFYDTSLKFNY